MSSLASFAHYAERAAAAEKRIAELTKKAEAASENVGSGGGNGEELRKFFLEKLNGLRTVVAADHEEFANTKKELEKLKKENAALKKSGGAAPAAPSTLSSEPAPFKVSNRYGDVTLGQGQKIEKHPTWYQPTEGFVTGLKVLNSLTGQLVPFVPAHGRRVLWYTCGPTVYDSCHMGHARAYLTFDILRRVMEDYFGYDVLYQVNITDIDDKIIMRARRNKLLKDYLEKKPAFAAVLKAVTAALAARGIALEAKKAKLESTVATAAAARDREEAQSALEAQTFKLQQLGLVQHQAGLIASAQKTGVATAFKALLGDAAKLGLALPPAEATLAVAAEALQDAIDMELQKDHDKKWSALPYDALGGNLRALVLAEAGLETALVTVASDELGEALDKELGSTVTDHAVFDAHARKFELEYMEDMRRLGVKDPDVLTRVTEYLPQIVAYVEGIVAKGLAYESKGSVYLSLDKFKEAGHDYRKCEPFAGKTSSESMAESEGALGGDGSDKKNPNDFVLWKSSKPGEPAWDSPWGKGRPGWHIECSVVAGDIMGGNMDVHAGGQDLKFPHHDNELAQSEAFHGHHQWVNYFFHAGTLRIQGLKMSKSLKNFIKIYQALKQHKPRTLRMMFLLQSWHKSMNYSDQTVGDAKQKVDFFWNFFGATKAILREDWVNKEVGWQKHDHVLADEIMAMQQKVHDCLCNNFDTVGAVLAMHETVTSVNKYMVGNKLPAVYLVKKAAVYITKILRVFGVVDGNEDIGWALEGEGGNADNTAPFVDAIVNFRHDVREATRQKAASKDDVVGDIMSLCDSVRDNTLVDLGVRCEDQDGKSRWKLDDPEKLRAEVVAKREADALAASKKRATMLAKKQKEMDKWVGVKNAPAEMFKANKDFSAFDARGVPTKDAAGKDLAKSAAKKAEKQFATYTKTHADLLTKSGGDIAAFLAILQQQVDSYKN